MNGLAFYLNIEHNAQGKQASRNKKSPQIQLRNTHTHTHTNVGDVETRAQEFCL